MNRRIFTFHVSAATTLPCFGQSEHLPYSALGACTSLENAEGVKISGGEYIEEAVKRFLVPEKPEEEWIRNQNLAKACPLPIAGCNGFLPGTLRCTGKDADHNAVLKYAETAFQRAKQVNLDYIVFGSSGSRNLNDGDTVAEAEQQFIELLNRMAPMAKAHGITVAVEPLRRQECNFINTMLEGAAIVEQVNHPNIRMVCDIYHMLQNGEDPDDLRRIGSLIHHCHIAEKEKRSAPGVMGDDFRPYFAALKSVGYNGRISIEGKWKPQQLTKAYETIRLQAREA